MTFASIGGVVLPILSGWEDNSQLILSHPRQDEFTPNVVVVRAAVNGRSMDQFIAQHMEQLARTFDGLQVGRSEPTQLGIHSGYLIDYTFTAYKKQYRQTQFFSMKNASIYTFTASATALQFPTFWPLVTHIITSARIEGTGPDPSRGRIRRLLRRNASETDQ